MATASKYSENVHRICSTKLLSVIDAIAGLRISLTVSSVKLICALAQDTSMGENS